MTRSDMDISDGSDSGERNEKAKGPSSQELEEKPKERSKDKAKKDEERVDKKRRHKDRSSRHYRRRSSRSSSESRSRSRSRSRDRGGRDKNKERRRHKKRSRSRSRSRDRHRRSSSHSPRRRRHSSRSRSRDRDSDRDRRKHREEKRDKDRDSRRSAEKSPRADVAEPKPEVKKVEKMEEPAGPSVPAVPLATSSTTKFGPVVKPGIVPLMSTPIEPPAGMAGPYLSPEEVAAQVKAAAERLRKQLAEQGSVLPSTGAGSIYNPNAVNAAKLAEQQAKRALLWKNKQKKEGEPDKKESLWASTSFDSEGSRNATEKFRKLMGIKNVTGPVPTSGPNLQEEQQKLFQHLDQQYEVARMSTHTHRGVGLGFSLTPMFPSSAPPPAPKES